MSNEENTEQQIEVEETVEEQAEPQTVAIEPEKAETANNNIVATLMALKDDNPKVFFGAIGGIVMLFGVMMMGGGHDPALSGPTLKNLAVGQKYVLKSANSYDSAAAVRLVAVPGAIAAYDDTEEADRKTPCQHISQGTPVTVTELQDAYGTKNAFVKVLMEDGECKGKDGWALAIDVQ